MHIVYTNPWQIKTTALTKTGETRYFPWGKDRAQGAPASGQTLTSYKFTGQREEAGLGFKP